MKPTIALSGIIGTNEINVNLKNTIDNLNLHNDINAIAFDWETVDEKLNAKIYSRNKISQGSIANADLIHIFTLGPVYTKWEKFADFLNILNESNKKIINPIETIKYGMNKDYLFDLQSKGIATIKSKRIKIPSSINELNKYHSEFAIIKPINGERAKGVTKLADMTSEDINHYKQTTSELILQPFMEEIYEGEYSIIFLNGEGTQAIKKIPKNNSFLANGACVGAKVKNYIPNKEELEFGKEIINSFKYKIHAFRLDYLKVNDKPQIMEIELVNPGYFMDNLDNHNEHTKHMSKFYSNLT
jgi:glutathione synthase/RimK-type ligase-like ATP-grasp enzyme